VKRTPRSRDAQTRVAQTPLTDKPPVLFQRIIEALLRRVTKSVDDVFGTLHKPEQSVRTLEEMKEAIAADLSDLLIARSAQANGYDSAINFDKKASRHSFFVLLK